MKPFIVFNLMDNFWTLTVFIVLIIEIILIFGIFFYEYFFKKENNTTQRSIKSNFKIKINYGAIQYIATILIIIVNCIFFYQTANEANAIKNSHEKHEKTKERLDRTENQLRNAREKNLNMGEKLSETLKENEKLKSENELMRNEVISLKEELTRWQEYSQSAKNEKNIKSIEIKNRKKPRLIIESYEVKR